MARKRTSLKSYSIDMTEIEYDSVMAFLSSLRSSTKKQTKKKNPRKLTLSADQTAALEIMENGENVFLTGGAGTGKTFLLDYFLANKRQAVRVAPTGKAAIKVGGMTIHRFFKAPIGIIQPSSLPEIGSNRKEAETALTKILRKRGAKLMKTVEIIAVDEISMCRADLFDYVMRIIHLAEFAFSKKIQLILSGDFYQLPPVVPSAPNRFNKTERTKQEWDVWSRSFPDNLGGWAFLSSSWKEAEIRRVELHEVIRQQDEDFAKALNEVRVGNRSGLSWIMNRIPKNLPNRDFISIVSTNKAAQTKNKEKLDALQGKPKTYKIDVPDLVNGNENQAEKKDWTSTCEDVLELKIGARVVALVNDNVFVKDEDAKEGEGKKPRAAYMNGSVGTVIALKEDAVTVLFDGKEKPVDLGPFTWTIYGYEIGKETRSGITYETINQIEIGEFSQIPLRLAWATTVHKSQGETYESAVNVLCAPQFFAPGQAYVALSRATSINFMHVTGFPRLLVADEVKKYYEGTLENEEETRQIVDNLIFEDPSFPTGIFSSDTVCDQIMEIPEPDENPFIPDAIESSVPYSEPVAVPSKRKKKAKVYVVKRGRQPGIYSTWEECVEQINHYPKASFKSFESMEEAQHWFQD